MKLGAVRSSFLIKRFSYIGDGRIVFKPLENMGVMINHFYNNAEIHKWTMSVLKV